MQKMILICLILSSCASFPQKHDCTALVEAEEARYSVCQKHVDECLAARKKDSPPLLSKAVWAVLGLGVGLVIGTKLAR